MSVTPTKFCQFRECQRILNCHSWVDRDAGIKAQFEAGARTAMGVFNLMMSTLPAKVLRLLEVIGFSGNKTYGMQELNRAAGIPNTLRTVMARLTLICWHLFITYLIGTAQPDLPLCKRLLAPLIRDYPNVSLKDTTPTASEFAGGYHSFHAGSLSSSKWRYRQRNTLLQQVH